MCIVGRSYFEAGSDSDDGEASRRSARPPDQGTFGDEDELTGAAEVEEDPLDAFMAAIEVGRRVVFNFAAVQKACFPPQQDQIEKQKKPAPPPPAPAAVVEVKQKPPQQFK